MSPEYEYKRSKKASDFGNPWRETDKEIPMF